MGTYTAQNILDQNNYTTSQCGLTDLEGLIDMAIAFVNAETGASISKMSGDAESKTMTLTDIQEACVYPLAVLLLRAHVDRGPNASLSSLSITTVIADPQFETFRKMLDKALYRLRISLISDPPIWVSNEPVPT